ncbi:MAG TPA: carbamoyltransferase C-terminal domain-containing protein [Leptospiraceae bacterium]|nr:carbamoyltransferase C-terminal domain-containing protein [Leptospiraceae bacterium]
MKPTFAIYGIKDRGDYEKTGYVHDHNLCLMQDGKVLKYLQLERFTRRKYDNRLDLYLEDIINEHIPELRSEFDFISVNSFVGSSFISRNGRIRFEADRLNGLSTEPMKGRCWFERENWTGREIPAYLCSHETAHIFSCIPFYGLFNDNSLLVHFDGGASSSNFSAFHWKNQKMNLLEHHWELSHLSKIFNDNSFTFRILGAKGGEHCSVPGKLMGYAGMGKTDPLIEEWIIRNNYFRSFWNEPEIILQSINQEFGLSLDRFDERYDFFQNAAASFQSIFEKSILDKLNALQKKTGAEYLYYSGGSALNIRANSLILRSGIFKDIFIPPCCNDSGLSLGAAAFLEYHKGSRIQHHSPFLNSIGCAFQSDVMEESVNRSAKLLSEGKVLAVSLGYGEVGPRALGSRSMLALADDRGLAEKINIRCKKREWYRPLAPVMLNSEAERILEEPVHRLSEYMLLEYCVRKEYYKELNGVVHKNGTVRAQTVSSEKENPFLFRLLRLLNSKYGVKALLNTSFNCAGEPIVHNYDDAVKSAAKLGADALLTEKGLALSTEGFQNFIAE